MTDFYKIFIVVLALGLIQGCAHEPQTLSQVFDQLEEDNYNNWEKDEAYFEKMEAAYLGAIANHLIISYDKTGQPLGPEYAENTLGYKPHEIGYAATTLFGSFTKLDLASLLVMNNDAPSFGSQEYVTQSNYRRDARNMSTNAHFFSSSFGFDELETYRGITPQSEHHEMHLKAKNVFITHLNETVEALNGQGIQCHPANYDPVEDGDDYSSSRLSIKPLNQYETGYDCHIDGKTYLLGLKTLVVMNDVSEHRVVSGVYLARLDNINQVDPIDILNKTSWQGTMSTCRTCDEELDRVVRIVSVNQPTAWEETFEKGSLYQ